MNAKFFVGILSAGSALAIVGSLIVVLIVLKDINNLYYDVMTNMAEFRVIANDAWREMITINMMDNTRHKRQYESTGKRKCNCRHLKCPKGPPGPPGEPGLPGKDAKSGIDGNPGINGKDQQEYAYESQRGKPILKCIKCPAGEPGLKGPEGKIGLPGPPGKNARDGERGLDGLPGPPGPVGDMGKRGINGKPGVPGEKGIDAVRYSSIPGQKGSIGPEGPPGKPGPDGKTSPGAIGPIGPPGPRGKPGISGLPGKAGAKGMQGIPGFDSGYCKCPRRTQNLVLYLAKSSGGYRRRRI